MWNEFKNKLNTNMKCILNSFDPLPKEQIKQLTEHVNRLYGITISENAEQILKIYSNRNDVKSKMICNIANLMRQQ
jgi:hypothetical protein